MPNSAATPGQAVVEYELVVPNGKPINLTSGIVNHDHSMLSDTVYGLCVYKHRLCTTNTDFVDNYMKEAMAGGTPRMRFRLGYGSPDNMFWLPWQEHVITYYAAILESLNKQSGHSVEIETQDNQFLLTRGSRVAPRKGVVSKIVSDIAASFGITETVIEPTKGDGIYIQSFSSDAEFIKNRMIRRATNEKSRGNYLFYFRDNALHFHSPDYQSDIHTVVYYQSNSAALTQSDLSQRLIDSGIAGTNVLAYDPYSGQTQVYASDPSEALRLSDSIYDFSKTGGIIQIPFHRGTNFQQEAEAIGQNTYEHARSETFSLTLEVDRTIQIRHGDFVNLVVTPTESKASPWSGYYLVTQVRHVIQKGSVRSLYTLARGEIKKSQGNLTSIQNQDILVIEQNAPGQSLNVSEIKSSQRTKGAGKLAADGKLYTTVQSPN